MRRATVTRPCSATPRHVSTCARFQGMRRRCVYPLAASLALLSCATEPTNHACLGLLFTGAGIHSSLNPCSRSETRSNSGPPPPTPRFSDSSCSFPRILGPCVPWQRRGGSHDALSPRHPAMCGTLLTDEDDADLPSPALRPLLHPLPTLGSGSLFQVHHH